MPSFSQVPFPVCLNSGSLSLSSQCSIGMPEVAGAHSKVCSSSVAQICGPDWHRDFSIMINVQIRDFLLESFFQSRHRTGKVHL